eukprot:gene12107-14308_t
MVIDAHHMALYKNLHQEVSTESGKLPSIFWSKIESKLDPFAIRPATLPDSAEHAAKKPRLSESPSVTGSDATKTSQFSKQFKQDKTCKIPWSFKYMNALAADTSGYAHFYNSEQMCIFMYHQHMPKPERDKEVNRRWDVKIAPSETHFAITKNKGINHSFETFEKDCVKDRSSMDPLTVVRNASDPNVVRDILEDHQATGQEPACSRQFITAFTLVFLVCGCEILII